MCGPMPVLPVLVLALAPPALPQDAGGSVGLPPFWYRGDTHAHIQLCGTAGGEPPGPDLTPEDLYQDQVANAIHVRFAQIWGQGIDDPEEFLTAYGPLVTGAESPASEADPDHVLWFGVEVSEFPSDIMGHLQVTGIADPAFPQEATWPGPPLDFFRAQPGALIGYAHVHTSTSYAVDDVPFFVPSAGPFGFFAPADAALGRIDFVESPRAVVTEDMGWYGLAYKLWNSGLRVSLTAGRDNTCLQTKVIGYAKVDADPLTFEGWKEAVRAGRTTIADDRFLFLDLEVGGAGIGGEVHLDGPGSVAVVAHLRVAPGVNLPGQAAGEIRIVQDGVHVALQEYDLPQGGEVTAKFSVGVQRSGWLAATVFNHDLIGDGGAHTAPVWVFVDDQPICGAAEGAYYEEYIDALSLLVQFGVFATGAAQPEVLAHLQAAREIYTALKLCGQPDVEGVERYGKSQPSELGPVHMGVTGPPVAGAPGFALTTLNAPPGAFGALLAGGSAAPPGATIGGLSLLVALDGSAILPLSANSGGYAKHAVDLLPPFAGQTVYVQSLWLDPTVWATAASDALAITVLP